jgi:hypothetical protein
VTFRSTVYLQLVENAVPFFQEHGTLDLVALADATSLGFNAEKFADDVADAAAVPYE